MSFSTEHLRHRRLVHVANALARESQPTKYQLQRFVEIWVDAGRAVGRGGIRAALSALCRV